MRGAGLVVIAVVCASLGFGAVVFWPTPVPEQGPRPLIDQPASAVVSVRTDSGRADRTGPETWAVTLSSTPTSEGEVRWAGESTRLRALTRLIAAAMGEPGGSVAPGGATASIGFADGSEVSLRFDPTPLAGRVGVEISRDGASWTTQIDHETSRLFTQGVSHWISMSAMPELPMPPGEPARVEIRARGQELVLDRLGARWVLRSPVADEADVGLVRLMIRQLSALAGERLLQSEDLPVGTPQGSISVFDSRNNGRRWQVDVFPAHDENRVLLRCSVLDGGGRIIMGPIGLEGDGSLIDRIDTEASAYLSRRVLREVASDITGLVLTSDSGKASFDRMLDGWQSAEEAPTPGAEGLAVLLTSTDAILALPMEEAVVHFSPRVRIEATNAKGTLLAAQMRVGIYAAPGGIPRLGIDKGGVLRVFETADAQAAWVWMQSVLEAD